MVIYKGMARNKVQGWESLHPNQQKLYQYLSDNAHDDQVTLADMSSVLDTTSLNTVVHHIRQLEKKGYIRRKGTGNQFEVLSAPVQDIVYLNLYGMAGCSPDGFFNDDNVVDRIPFPAKRMSVPADSFLVEARNDSMEPLIHDRDLVLVDKGPVENGSIVVVVHKDGAKIKKIFKDKKHMILQSLNQKYDPDIVEADDIRIVGSVRGVIRNFPMKV